MKKYFLILLLVLCGASVPLATAQHSQTKGYYDLLKRTGIFSQATYTDSLSRITFAALDSIPHDSVLTGKGTAASPLSIKYPLPWIAVADSLKSVRVNASGTGYQLYTPSAGGGKQNLSAGSSSVSQASTRFISLDGNVSVQTVDPSDPAQTSAQFATQFSVAGTLKNLRVRANTAPASGQTFTITVHKNGVATALTATVTDAGVLASDLVNTVSFAAADLGAIKIVTSATSGSFSGNISFEFIPN